MDLMQVYKPEKRAKKDTEGQNLALAAATMGLVAAAAPPLGFAMLGTGAGIGAAGAGVYGLVREKPKQPQQEGTIGYGESAVSRRLRQSQGDPLADLQAAQQALTNIDLPDEIKIEYERPINMALERYQKRYG